MSPTVSALYSLNLKKYNQASTDYIEERWTASYACTLSMYLDIYNSYIYGVYMIYIQQTSLNSKHHITS